MKKRKIYCIYAIIAGRKVFVGKTTSKDRQSILWRHLRGENKYTHEHFMRGALEIPSIYPLEHIHTDFSMAYRHVVAYMRAFIDEGFEVLNSPGMLEDARNIHPITQTILDSIILVPMEHRIKLQMQKQPNGNQNTNVVKEPAGDEKTNPQKELATEKLTVRLTPKEKKEFLDLALKTGVSQRQLLMLLMTNQQYDFYMDVDWGSVDYVRILLGAYRSRNDKLEEETEKLRQQLRDKGWEEKQMLQKRESEMVKNIDGFFNYFTSLHQDNLPLEQGLYKDYFADTPYSEYYQYPDNEDVFLFYPESILLGKGRYAPLFITGYDRYQRKVLLRFYRKTYFVGFSFTNEEFGVQGSCWLVRCERAKDGAMDLVFALPVDITHKNYPNEKRAGDGQVDELIANARYRSP